MNEERNYAVENRSLIENYLKGKDAVTVDEIMNISGVEKLRVYTILFQMEVEEGILEVLEREELGAAKVVRMKR